MHITKEEAQQGLTACLYQLWHFEKNGTDGELKPLKMLIAKLEFIAGKQSAK